jgi:hypothetical protein
MAKKKDPRLEKYGLEGYNKPKRTPDHPTKKGVVLAKDGDTVKLVRFGDQKMTTAGKPSASDSAKDKARRESFKSRHAKNIARGKLSGAYWANKELW